MTCGARDITPTQPSPIEGEGSQTMLAIGATSRRRVVFIECRAKALPLDGGGLGGGDAAKLSATAVAALPDQPGLAAANVNLLGSLN